MRVQLRHLIEQLVAIDTAVAQRRATLHVPNPRSDRDAQIAGISMPPAVNSTFVVLGSHSSRNQA